MRTLEKIITSYIDCLNSSFPCLDLVVPIPLHRKKLRERGFNQAELIAKVVAKHLQVRLTKGNLKRRKATITQTSLDREERRRNLREAFTVKNRDEFQAKNVLLVDDVYTTGATIKEAAKVLKEARVKDVYVFALARAPQP
jgi:ComF family protein